MKGDFSRVTFDPLRHFTRVLRQQGRVDLDADFNEQVALFWHYLRRLAADLIGTHGGPEGNCAFEVFKDLDTFKAAFLNFALSDDETTDFGSLRPGDFLLSPGHYYVDGLLCEAERPFCYCHQPFLREVPPLAEREALHHLYLDVWERHVSHLQDDQDVRIREVALGGPDTATRAQMVWQVKLVNDDGENGLSSAEWRNLLEGQQPSFERGLLRVRARLPEGAALTEPCITSPEARYRGLENQLYRVEIHRGGKARQDEGDDGATFKWSRENGSVAFPIRTLSANLATLEALNTGDRLGIEVGNWVEITDDDRVLGGEPGILAEVETVESPAATVTLEYLENLGEGSRPDYGEGDSSHPVLRRWDHRPGDPGRGGPELADDGALHVVESRGSGDGDWIPLEDGIEIQFVPPEGGDGHTYWSGDHWWFAARTATRDVEWPGGPEHPEARPPHGVEHHYAPLGTVNRNGNGVAYERDGDHRRRFKDLYELTHPGGG